MVATSLGQTLPIYGVNLFEEAPTTFAPVDHAPVTSDYVIGPGDELLIRGLGDRSIWMYTLGSTEMEPSTSLGSAA